MKRFFTIFLTSLLVLSLAACGGEGSKVDAAWKTFSARRTTRSC